MTRMRAKMRITAVTPYPTEGDPSQETLQFHAVAKDGPYPSVEPVYSFLAREHAGRTMLLDGGPDHP